MKKKSIYVEIPIRTSMDDLWKASQEPSVHERWDLRFSSITYLPKAQGSPQRFTYKTRIGFGLDISGWGQSVTAREGKDGARTSSLHFGTEQKRSIIREGRGFWKYVPRQDGGVTFLTRYDYTTNFGAAGRLFDRLCFRPLIGWATALSFDVLKRWLEKGTVPEVQYRNFFVTWLSAILFSFIWIYHGLVPKLIFQHPQELAMLTSVLPIGEAVAHRVMSAIGIGEVVIGLLWLLCRRKRWLFAAQTAAFPLLTIGAVTAAPESLTQPFNPLTFNLALFALSFLGFSFSKDVPTAKYCRRRQVTGE
ncbi:UNVERIFIED_CONTAM: DoxX-like family protein [Halobacillus marinus]